ncbi:MAG: peptidoglycan-binding domain-containing protein [Pseudomonadota bacterium]
MKELRFGPLGLIAIAPVMGATAFAQPADLPPNPKPGECYSRVLTPERYETVTEQVVVQPATERIEVVPAKYAWEEREIVVEEGYERLEVVPAKFSTRTETVTVEPAREEMRVIPAKYETRQERVKIRDAYTTWKKGTGPISRLDASTGEIMCLVEVPAEFKTVSRQVMVSPPRTEKVRVPAKTREVSRRVISQPATTRKISVPAKTQTVRYQKLVTPPQEKKMTVPAVTDTVSTRKLVSQSKLQWASILCETNVTPGVVRNLQQALTREGVYNGAIDGRLGPETMAAVDAYQRRKNLSTGSLTIETMKRLGVSTATS